MIWTLEVQSVKMVQTDPCEKGFFTFLSYIFRFHSADQLFPKKIHFLPFSSLFTTFLVCQISPAVDIVEGYELIEGVYLIDEKNFC